MTADHVVLPDDEARHTPDGEDLWNESYYCDFVRADGSMGGWLRLGLYPNRQVAWWTTWIVWPDRPGVCSVDYRAPVPPGDGLVSESADGATHRRRIEIDLRRPLEEFRLAAQRPGPHRRPRRGRLRPGEQTGTRVRLDLDLTWTTDGVPYHYDLTTRYEIPCLVAGTVTVDGETFSVDGQGQRDHSWGVRDWWAFGWCWCSMRLDDGTRVHLADIRMDPGRARSSSDISRRRARCTPATALTVTEDVGDARLPIQGAHRDRRRPRPQAPTSGVGIEVTPVAFGPVLLRNDDDGRTSRFPRAMVRCRTDDGRRSRAGSSGTSPTPPRHPEPARRRPPDPPTSPEFATPV